MGNGRDLYYLVKYLPAYALPTGLPSNSDLTQPENFDIFSSKLSSRPSPFANGSHQPRDSASSARGSSFLYQRTPSASAPHLPLPATAIAPKKTVFLEPTSPRRTAVHRTISGEREKVILPRADEIFLLPAHIPPEYHFLDLFPFSLVVKMLTKRGKDIKGKKAAKLRAKMRTKAISHNLPLEISLYLVGTVSCVRELTEPHSQSSYIASLQHRKLLDVPTTS